MALYRSEIFGSYWLHSVATGSMLNVCPEDELQCCSQSDEDALGMTLSSAFRNVTLGDEFEALMFNATNLYTALSSKLYVFNDVLTRVCKTMIWKMCLQ